MPPQSGVSTALSCTEHPHQLLTPMQLRSARVSSSASQLTPSPAFLSRCPCLFSMFVSLLLLCTWWHHLNRFFYIPHTRVLIYWFSLTLHFVWQSLSLSTSLQNDLIQSLMAEGIILFDAIINVFSFLYNLLSACSLLMYKNASDFSAHSAFCYLVVRSDRVFQGIFRVFIFFFLTSSVQSLSCVWPLRPHGL